jgi:HSP20 family protein
MRSFDDMDQMFREMDRMFNQFRTMWMDEYPIDDRRYARPAFEGDAELDTVDDSPAANLEEADGDYVFVMDLPGFEKEDIDLSLQDGVLSVRAHTDIEEGSDAYRALRSRQISRQVRIPKAVETDEISAKYHNGVLEVRLPIVANEEDDDHRIEIE